jgi:putative tricarboxylic transport membrane protein
MAETQLRRALSISQCDPFTLVSIPISATLLSILVLVLVLPAILRWFLPKKEKAPGNRRFPGAFW